MPKQIAYASGNVIESEGSLYIFGGKEKNGVSNEVWKLNIEKIV